MKTLKVLDAISLSGRRALVLGGGGYIGRAASLVLSELGAQVAIGDRDQLGMDKTVAALAGEGAETFSRQVDLSCEEETRATIRECVSQMGGLDILVHTAAFVNQGNTSDYAAPFEEQGAQPWRTALDINVTSAFVAVQEARSSLARDNGAVILFGSIYGLCGPDNRLYEDMKGVGNAAAYAASKGAVLQLTRWLSTSLAPSIRVNAISPGGIERGQDPIFIERYRTRTPMGRMGTEDDLKGAVAFLASDLSRYVTGQNLVVDGGWTAW